MKCENCEFWKKCKEHEDYGTCYNPDNADSNNTFDGDNAYPPDIYKHKNDCCSLYVAVKITKE